MVTTVWTERKIRDSENVRKTVFELPKIDLTGYLPMSQKVIQIQNRQFS